MSKILLVEDDQMISKMIKLRLTMNAHEVDCAFDGQEGFEKAISSDYDLVLLDMHMPIMGGCEAAQKLRENDYKGVIVAVTASVMKEDTESALNAGCNYFIAKPLGDDFEEKVENILKLAKQD